MELLITGPAGVGKSILCWEMSALLRAAIPDAAITVVRLMASEIALPSCLAQREIGFHAEEQYERSLRQARKRAALDRPTNR